MKMKPVKCLVTFLKQTVLILYFFKYIVLLGWTSALVSACWVIYGIGMYKLWEPPILPLRLPSKGFNIFYNGVSRAMWGMSLAWITWASAKGYGGTITLENIYDIALKKEF